MPVERIDTLVVGGGQAGLAMSKHLGMHGIEHLVVERHRIAERWRSERWDTLVANGPAWHDRFPDLEFTDVAPDSFATRDQIVDYFVTYAKQIDAPVRCGIEVTALHQLPDRMGFRASTTNGVIEARNVVAATGPFQRPIIPALVPPTSGVEQMHSAAYRNPGQLRDGAVLVVGAGSSGSQIAGDLVTAGRHVFLSVGPHDRPPRRYRGRDFVWWLGALGLWDAVAREPGTEHITIAVSGADGGQTVDFRSLAARGIELLGRAEAFANGVMRFAPDLEKNIALGDANYLSILDSADALVVREGLDLPADPEARKIDPFPRSVTDPVLQLDLKRSGITTIIWATGYALDFGWLKFDAFDACGRPRHKRGISEIPGFYFLGLPWLSRRASPFIWGTWHDAAHLANHIAQRV